VLTESGSKKWGAYFSHVTPAPIWHPHIYHSAHKTKVQKFLNDNDLSSFLYSESQLSIHRYDCSIYIEIMDPLSLSASVAGLLCLAIEVGKILGKYIGDVKQLLEKSVILGPKSQHSAMS
jgi:hypothetical protein